MDYTSESESEYSDNEFNSDILVDNILPTEKIQYKIVTDSKDKISRNLMTIYEKVRILGTRETQLKAQAPSMIDINGTMSFADIAKKELELNMIPFKIKRTIDNIIEIWSLDELKKDHLD
jgi:DNA-directed RNA polymerase subunit K/omega